MDHENEILEIYDDNGPKSATVDLHSGYAKSPPGHRGTCPQESTAETVTTND